MNRQPVTSSNIRSVGYHEGTLEIEFNSGRVYQYLDVAPLTHIYLMNAESKGKYFAERIRDHYEAREVIVEPQPDFDALVNGITAWQDEDQRGVYLDHAKRLYTLGITHPEMLRALLTTLYRTAIVNEASRAANELAPSTAWQTETLQERINYRPGGV